jgi:hypothetical protein
MASKHFLSRSMSVLVTLIGCAMLSACTPTASRSGQQAKSAQSPAQLVAELQQAKATDEESLKDSTISIPRRGDLLDHTTQAEFAIRDLRQGVAVPDDEITYALEVPPKHILPEQKAALIAQLKDAIRKDESREQAVVSFGSDIYYQDPDAPSEFGNQEQSAQEQIRNLEQGTHVSWEEVQKALYVPPDRL